MAPPTRKSSEPKPTTGGASAGAGSANSSSESKDRIYVCRDCKRPCSDSDKALCCSLCHEWFHAKCQGFTADSYQLLLKDSQSKGGSCLQFYCRPSCNKLAEDFLSLFINVQTQVKQLRTEVGEVKDKVDKIEDGKFTPKMVEKIEEICQTGAAAAAAASPLAPVDKEEIQSLINKSSRDSIAETEERAKRSKNAIVFGIPEAKSLEREDRIREEYQKCNTLMTKIGCLQTKPQHVRRLGEYRPNQDKPCPIRLIFANQIERDQVLNNFRMTRKQDQAQNDEEYEPVLEKELNMKRDMTRLEQKEDSDLYRELKAKKDQSKEAGDGIKWIRKNGRVIQAAKRKQTTQTPESAQEEDDEGQVGNQ